MYKPFPRGSATMIKSENQIFLVTCSATEKHQKTEKQKDAPICRPKTNGPMACFRVSVIKLSCGWVCHVSLMVATYLCPSLTALWDRTPKTLWSIKQERTPEITETKYETFHSSQSEVFCSEILAASLQSPDLPEAEQLYRPLVLLPHKTFKVMIRLREFAVRSLNKVHDGACIHQYVGANPHICGQQSNCLVSASFVKQDHGMDLQTFGQRTCSWQNSCMSMYGLFAPQNEMLVKPLETSLNTPPILHAACILCPFHIQTLAWTETCEGLSWTSASTAVSLSGEYWEIWFWGQGMYSI